MWCLLTGKTKQLTHDYWTLCWTVACVTGTDSVRHLVAVVYWSWLQSKAVICFLFVCLFLIFSGVGHLLIRSSVVWSPAHPTCTSLNPELTPMHSLCALTLGQKCFKLHRKNEFKSRWMRIAVGTCFECSNWVEKHSISTNSFTIIGF